MALSLWLNSDTVHTNLAEIETNLQQNTGSALLDVGRMSAETERVINYASAGVDTAQKQLDQLEAKPVDTLSATELAAAYELKGPVADSLDGLSMSELAEHAHKVANGTDRVQQYIMLRHLENALQAADNAPQRLDNGLATGLPAHAPVAAVAADRAALHAVAKRLEARLLGHWDIDTLENARMAAKAELMESRRLKLRATRALSKLGIAQTSSTLTGYSDL